MMSSTLVDAFADGTSAVLEPLTVEQYHAMLQNGVLREGEPVELIDGLLLRKDRRVGGGSIMTVGPRHANTVTRVARILDRMLDSLGVHCRSQQPVTLSDKDEPEPDIVVAEGAIDDYAARHPGLGQIPLVIEVAESSLDFDRGRKREMYAAAGIPVYLIVDLRNDSVEVHTEPQAQAQTYRKRSVFGRGESVALKISDKEVELSVDEVLGG